MGSWANSLHVRHDDSAVVQEAIRATLLAEGHELAGDPVCAAVSVASAFAGDDNTDSPAEDWKGPKACADDWDDDSLDELDGPEDRRLWVSRACRGWVGILDSEVGGGDDLAQELSRRLRTDALWVMVNDSDGWLYSLHRQGHRLDVFDSLGDEGMADEFSPELQAALEHGDQDAIDKLIEQELSAHAPTGRIALPDGHELLPFEMCTVLERIRSGEATWRERLSYQWWWVKFLFRLLTGRAGHATGDFGFDIPRGRPLSQEELQKHVAVIRGVFPRADEQTLLALLPQNRFPSEGQLEKFLQAVGLPGRYAYLSYDYLEDFGEAELLEHDIILAAEMRFRSRQ